MWRFYSDDKGIKGRIELAMDLVKSHLTMAVNQEMVSLKNTIDQLTEKCNRLEQSNQILEQNNQILMSNALPETLALLNQSSLNSSIGNNTTSKLPR